MISVKVLEKHTANPNAQSSLNLWAPIHLACYNNHSEVVKALVKFSDAKYIADLQNQDGKTPLHIATENSNVDIIRILINHTKTGLSLPDGNGHTPFSIAETNRETEILNVFRNFRRQQCGICSG